MVSNQTTISLPSSPVNSSLKSPSSSSSMSSSSSLLESSNNSSGPEVGSLFTFDPHILQPFMGLQSVDRADDPWHHKAYNLYQPIFTGGGTFEEYINTGRYKRDLNEASESSPLSRFSKNSQILTPEMLVHLLRMKSSFKKNYPGLYKSMIGKFDKDKSTTITITPPEVPKHVSHKNVELAAAEINPLESLIPSYQQDLENILKAQKGKIQQGSLDNFYTNEFNFWTNSQEVQTADEETPDMSTTSSSSFNNLKEEQSFWSNPQETLQTLEEEHLKEPEKISFNEQSSFWENSEESLKTLSEHQLLSKNPKKNQNTGDYSNSKENNEEALSYWENSQEILKTFNEQKEFLDQSQDHNNKEHNFWEHVEEAQDEDNGPKHNGQSSLKEDYVIWKSHMEPSIVQKRSSFWAELEAAEEEQHHQKQQDQQHFLDDSEPIFDFDEDIE